MSYLCSERCGELLSGYDVWVIYNPSSDSWFDDPFRHDIITDNDGIWMEVPSPTNVLRAYMDFSKRPIHIYPAIFDERNKKLFYRYTGSDLSFEFLLECSAREDLYLVSLSSIGMNHLLSIPFRWVLG